MSLNVLTFVGLAVGLATGCYSRGTDHTVDEVPDAADPAPPAYRFGQSIHLPARDLGLTTAETDLHGRLARATCATCHAAPAAQSGSAPALPEGARLHAEFSVAHGELACDSCHAPPLYQRFRLATGATIAYADVMQLCAQCHGRQYRDYQHAAHGGLSGHWDLNAGPRDRNHCIACHDPHAPAISQVMPAPPPRYRAARSR